MRQLFVGVLILASLVGQLGCSKSAAPMKVEGGAAAASGRANDQNSSPEINSEAAAGKQSQLPEINPDTTAGNQSRPPGMAPQPTPVKRVKRPDISDLTGGAQSGRKN